MYEQASASCPPDPSDSVKEEEREDVQSGLDQGQQFNSQAKQDEQNHQIQTQQLQPQPQPQPHNSSSITNNNDNSNNSHSNSNYSPPHLGHQQQNSYAQPKTKIFVGRLPEGCTSKDLEDLFAKYGTVSECDVVGKFGFVHMSKPEEAEECVKKLNKYSFMGSQLTVEFSTSKVHPEPGTLGRAKNVMRAARTDYRNRNGPYPREPYRGGARPGYGYKGGYYYDDYQYERDPYYDYYRDRDRRGLDPRYPPPPYDRREYDDYARRDYPSMGPAAPIPPPENIYARRGPPPRPYDRNSDISTPMYSTRSPELNAVPPYPGPTSLPMPPPPTRSQYWTYPQSPGDEYRGVINRYDERGPLDPAPPANPAPSPSGRPF